MRRGTDAVTRNLTVDREEFEELLERVQALEAFLVVDRPPKRDRAAYMGTYRERVKAAADGETIS